MSVFVVFHADLEDDRYVRAVYSTEARARAKVASPDPCSQASCTGWSGDKAHTVREFGEFVRYTADRWECIGARSHDTYCCGVETYELDASPVQVIHEAVPA